MLLTQNFRLGRLGSAVDNSVLAVRRWLRQGILIAVLGILANHYGYLRASAHNILSC